MARFRTAQVAGALAAVLTFAPGAFALEGQNPGDADDPTFSRATIYRQVEKLRVLGRRMFRDPALSASGKMSCASCHDPSRGFSPANAASVQLGGVDLDRPGLRAPPSLCYKQGAPPFSRHFYESEEESPGGGVDAGPTGGLTWDGRVDAASQQALIPLFSPFEMANKNASALNALIEANYGATLRKALTDWMPQGPHPALQAAVKALQIYQETPQEFFAYSSKYDAYLGGAAALSDQEKRGLDLFNDEKKGNCASCHISLAPKTATRPRFTDDGLVALGLPRNREIAANADPAFYDLGLCGPERTDLKDHPEYCGLFKAPTLRNVALRKAFFHNGVIHDLRGAVAFYVERDVKPEKWYPRRADGSIDKFDDLPPQYWDNVNMEPPFGGKPGDAPALNDAEIDDVVAFLETLTDGYISNPRIGRR
ncbi:cytochrome-c peroxidase [Methylocapsa acidiphila]|uniref:cytochrome-c peroxidase n=1 Tax=Methylocapsa acidiphila TaxID=133552 RepID=UPI00041E4332|nr:cytochrome c peroxidase [Methylocapsa acidiphila]